MNDKPEPDTKFAWLPSAGLDYMRATRHSYLETRAVMLPAPDGHAYEFIYICDETGAERRWGTCDQPSWLRN